MGYGQRITNTRMPSIKYSAQSIADLKQLQDFLTTQDADVARRAIFVIRDALEKIAVMPERFRPVEGKMYHREALIDFGSSGYIAMFRHLPNATSRLLASNTKKRMASNSRWQWAESDSRYGCCR
jgi:plasmid stabilization system protein ParE